MNMLKLCVNIETVGPEWGLRILPEASAQMYRSSVKVCVVEAVREVTTRALDYHVVSVSIAVQQSNPKLSSIKEQRCAVVQEFTPDSAGQLSSMYKSRELPWLHSPAIGLDWDFGEVLTQVVWRFSAPAPGSQLPPGLITPFSSPSFSQRGAWLPQGKAKAFQRVGHKLAHHFYHILLVKNKSQFKEIQGKGTRHYPSVGRTGACARS